MRMKSRLTLATVALVASVGLAGAQTAQDHAVHHPADQDATQTQSPAMPPRGGPMARGPAKPGAMPMEQGARGMMSGHDMMQMMTMMEMMRGRMMAGAMAQTGMMRWRVEGRIAFYKAELKITDDQTTQWNAFADALRAAASRPQAAMQADAKLTAPDQMERRITALTARVDAMKSVLAAARPLYAVLSDDQKRTADELMTEQTMAMPARSMPMPQ